jgi:hypothetical protein
MVYRKKNKLGVPLDKNEVFVKAQFTCAVGEHRDHGQRG